MTARARVAGRRLVLELAFWTVLGVLFPIPVIPWLAWRAMNSN